MTISKHGVTWWPVYFFFIIHMNQWQLMSPGGTSHNISMRGLSCTAMENIINPLHLKYWFLSVISTSLFMIILYISWNSNVTTLQHIDVVVNIKDLAYLLVGRHAFSLLGLGCVAAQGLVVVPSAGLFAEAPWLSVWIHTPQFIVAFSRSQLRKRWHNDNEILLI